VKKIKVYYAHHLWKYNTPIEIYELELIHRTFPNAIIVNPNTDIEQNRDESEIMIDCISSVESCDAIVFSSMDGVIGRGVFDEVKSAKSVYYIYGNKISKFYGSFEIIQNSDTNRIYATVTF